ncbi:MAG: LPS export ABC transporter periplasmic protein LptC [Alphaproteobacteria bacterium]|nr:LPS export ABC transporter periplasmic protein LptC [Alphaproteobacteria bacterium]
MPAQPATQPAKPPRRGLVTVSPRLPSAMRRRFRFGSRGVTFLKVTLPLIALVLLGLVLAWPRLNPDPREFRLGAGNVTAVVDADSSRMLKPRYVGMDESNQPFTVVAETATHAGSADRIQLASPKADVTMKDGSWVAVNAKEGLYDRVRQTLGLRGQVQVFHDAGYEFHTEAADVDMAAGTAVGNQRVEGQGPFGHLTAEGFEILDKGGRILFTGKARLELRPQAMKKPEAKR